MFGLTTVAILAGMVIGMPLLLLTRIVGGTIPPELIAPTVVWWFVMLVLTGLIDRLALGRPVPTTVVTGSRGTGCADVRQHHA